MSYGWTWYRLLGETILVERVGWAGVMLLVVGSRAVRIGTNTERRFGSK